MANLKMTRNEYHEHLQKCISRAYDKNDNYTFADYWKENIEIIPLDLSAYPQIKEDTAQYINSVFDMEDIEI